MEKLLVLSWLGFFNCFENKSEFFWELEMTSIFLDECRFICEEEEFFKRVFRERESFSCSLVMSRLFIFCFFFSSLWITPAPPV